MNPCSFLLEEIWDQNFIRGKRVELQFNSMKVPHLCRMMLLFIGSTYRSDASCQLSRIFVCDSQEPRHVPVGSGSLADVILKSSDVKVRNEALKVPSLGGRNNLHNLHIGCKAVTPKAQQKPRLQSKSRTEDGLTRHRDLHDRYLQSWKRSMFQS